MNSKDLRTGDVIVFLHRKRPTTDTITEITRGHRTIRIGFRSGLEKIFTTKATFTRSLDGADEDRQGAEVPFVQRDRAQLKRR